VEVLLNSGATGLVISLKFARKHKFKKKKLDRPIYVRNMNNTVMNLIFWVGYKNNSYIRKTQENSIEIPLQTSLPFILLPMVHAHYCAPYPK